MSRREIVPPHPEAIILDLDDTLVDWSGSLPAAWESVCNRLAQGADARTLNAVLAYSFMAEPGRNDTDVFLDCLAQVGIPAPSDTTSIFESFTQTRLEATKPLNGAADAIRRFRDRVSKLSVLTNGDPDHQREKINRTGVAELFDVILVSGDVGIQKPDPRFYQIALQSLGVEPSDAWMVGDSLEFDVAVPQELGMRGIWVVWPASKYRHMSLAEEDLPQNLDVVPDLVVKRIGDLVRYLGYEDDDNMECT